uniref:Large ribosomal subunit protein P1 n=1 Tax=Polyorchis penicillatus TaxID=6091 RepID=RLA1_POLPE|nr:RecName: Full=Large ribosomal subunit protein P1; AltName: Full=60S acidic ribosomal protein P1; Short=A1 [Polyorchis penicillatus]AAA29791.1 A1 acidic ribosomal protein [Polyorchis penicillatus]
MADSSTSELACVYSALILHDDAITAEKMNKIISAANVNVEPYWPGLFALEGKNIGDLICNVGSSGPAAGAPAAGAAGGAVEEKKEEKKAESEDESDDDMGLFD